MKNIAIVCGGYSKEAIVSLRSAEQIIQVMDSTKFNSYTVYIDKTQWVAKLDGNDIAIDKNDFSFKVDDNKICFDAVFMAIHGTPGEDGKLQGYFEMLNIPVTTCDAFVSALTFNKFATKQYLKQFDIAMCDILVLKAGQSYDTEEIAARLGFPLFVKPNAGGSSFGVSKVKQADELKEAIELAFAEDDEVVIEPFIKGREFTCGIFKSNDKYYKLPVTEIVSKTDFFDYEAKYEGKSEEITPARLTEQETIACQKITEQVYDIFNCKGAVRVDYIFKDDTFHFMEVNTVPGMSRESIIPQQVRAFGISETEFYTALIEDSIERNSTI